MTKDVKISVKAKLLQALHGDITPELEQKLQAMAQSGSFEQAAMPRADISHYPDEDLELNSKFKPLKKAISIRMDVDLLDWFKAQPGKYQKLINKACRAYMNSAKNKVEV